MFDPLRGEGALEPSSAETEMRAALAGDDDQRADAVAGAYRTACAWLAAACLAIAAAMVFATGVAVDARGTGETLAMVAGVLGVARVGSAKALDPRISDGFGTLGLVWCAALACGVVALLGLRVHWPLQDSFLLSLDRSLGADSLGFLGWVANHRELDGILSAAYHCTVPLLVISILAVSLSGDRIETWRGCFCFVTALLAVCLISILSPAKGLGMWVPDALVAQLPDGALRFFWPSFDEFYGAAHPVLRGDSIDGVISFPSFHAVMGLIVVALWRKRVLTLVVALSWLAAMIPATIPIGGHYVVDLLGGGLIWAGSFAMSRRVERNVSRGRAAA